MHLAFIQLFNPYISAALWWKALIFKSLIISAFWTEFTFRKMNGLLLFSLLYKGVESIISWSLKISEINNYVFVDFENSKLILQQIFLFWSCILHNLRWGHAKNVGPILSSVFTFIGYKQTKKQSIYGSNSSMV